MTQKPSKRLQTVLKLARLKEQQAAEKLASCIRNAANHNQQLDQLQNYKGEYNNQFRRSVGEGVSALQLANFQRFYENLESVGETQRERKILADKQREQARLHWQQLYARQQNMNSLIESKQQQEERELEKKQQREQDDRKRFNPFD